MEPFHLYRKEIPVKSNLIIKTTIALILTFASLQANSCNDLNLTTDQKIVFGFFNGVQTTPKEARKALRLIQTQFLSPYVSSKYEKINYTLFYNKTEGFADFSETFNQRAKEHVKILADKYEIFWKIMHEDISFLNKIKKAIPALDNLIDAEKQAEKAASIAAITNLITKSKTTDIMYSDHKKKIDCIEEANRKFLIFAHSQGNLFATQAYDYATKIKNAPADSVAVVHVAPASPTLRGKHFLEDLDLVINGLRVFGKVPSITHYMSVLRAPGLNGETDPLGHGLLEIYLNPTIDVEGDIYIEVTNLFDTLKFPHKSDINSNDNNTTPPDDNNQTDDNNSDNNDNNQTDPTQDPNKVCVSNYFKYYGDGKIHDSLKKGDKDAQLYSDGTKHQVKELQEFLEAFGYDVGSNGADGWFGSDTKDALIEFQDANGLDADGIVGPNTREVMNNTNCYDK